MHSSTKGTICCRADRDGRNESTSAREHHCSMRTSTCQILTEIELTDGRCNSPAVAFPFDSYPQILPMYLASRLTCPHRMSFSFLLFLFLSVVLLCICLPFSPTLCNVCQAVRFDVHGHELTATFSCSPILPCAAPHSSTRVSTVCVCCPR